MASRAQPGQRLANGAILLDAGEVRPDGGRVVLVVRDPDGIDAADPSFATWWEIEGGVAIRGEYRATLVDAILSFQQRERTGR